MMQKSQISDKKQGRYGILKFPYEFSNERVDDVIGEQHVIIYYTLNFENLNFFSYDTATLTVYPPKINTNLYLF